MQVFLYNVHKTVVAVDRLRDTRLYLCRHCLTVMHPLESYKQVTWLLQLSTSTWNCDMYLFTVQQFNLSSNRAYMFLQCFSLLVGWQEGHPACKKLSGGVLAGYLSAARCRLVCFSKIQIGFTFLVLAHPGKRAIKRACVYIGTWTVFL